MFYEIAMKAFEDEEFHLKVEEFKKFLYSKNVGAYEYFSKNYLDNDLPVKWSKTYREEYSMTNNISEALNNKIKCNYKLERRMRMDKLVFLIMNTIVPDFIFETFKGTETFKGLKLNETTVEMIEKNDYDTQFDIKIKRLRSKFRNLTDDEREQSLKDLQKFIDLTY